jgi:hypothetical protein
MASVVTAVQERASIFFTRTTVITMRQMRGNGTYTNRNRVRVVRIAGRRMADYHSAVLVDRAARDAVKKQHPHSAAVHVPVVISACPHGHVAYAIAIEITQLGHRGSE